MRLTARVNNWPAYKNNRENNPTSHEVLWRAPAATALYLCRLAAALGRPEHSGVPPLACMLALAQLQLQDASPPGPVRSDAGVGELSAQNLAGPAAHAGVAGAGVQPV